MEKKYDLHMHSTCSDGSDPPKELVDMAKKIGLSGISITDHDTVDAYTDELFDYAKEVGIEVVPGVEFSTHYGDDPVHILGLYIDCKSEEIQQLTKAHLKRRKDRNEGILKRLAAHGMEISPEELYSVAKGSVGRPHIAQLMVEKGYIEEIRTAFHSYIGDDKPCFVKGVTFGVEETIKIIHAAGGKALFAHPILLNRHNLIRQICQMGFDGMECYYAKFPEKQCMEMVRIAERYNLLVTGGSDYHGKIKAFNCMGSAYTDEASMEKLRL